MFCFSNLITPFLLFVLFLDKSADGQLRQRFEDAKKPVDAFCKICYVGIKTANPPTNFSSLRDCITEQLKDTSIRSPRKPEIVYESLKVVYIVSLRIKYNICVLFLNIYLNRFTCLVSQVVFIYKFYKKVKKLCLFSLLFVLRSFVMKYL